LSLVGWFVRSLVFYGNPFGVVRSFSGRHTHTHTHTPICVFVPYLPPTPPPPLLENHQAGCPVWMHVTIGGLRHGARTQPFVQEEAPECDSHSHSHSKFAFALHRFELHSGAMHCCIESPERGPACVCEHHDDRPETAAHQPTNTPNKQKEIHKTYSTTGTVLDIDTTRLAPVRSARARVPAWTGDDGSYPRSLYSVMAGLFCV